MVTVSGYEIGLGGGSHRDVRLSVGLGVGGLAAATTAAWLVVGAWAGVRVAAAAGGVLAVIGLVAAFEISATEAPRRPITLASWVTLGRGGLVAAIAGLVAAVGLPATGTAAWLPGAAFGLAAALDRVDGWLARTRDAETSLGARLDIETDALLVLVGATAVVAAGLAPVAVLAVGLARYLYLGGQSLRRYRGRPAGGERGRWLNRVMYVLMVVAIWIALLPITDPGLTRPLVVAVSVPFVLNFLRSWIAAGRQPETA